jgi:hypothetical protein
MNGAVGGFEPAARSMTLAASAVVRCRVSATLMSQVTPSVPDTAKAANDSTSLAGYAQSYARAGFHPVVLREGQKVPAFKGWQTMAISDVVKALELNPRYNLGLALPEQWMVLDVDVKNGANGFETLQMFEENHGPLPDTPQQTTAHSGQHFVFRLPTGVRVTNKVGIAPGLDVRTNGGYIVVEPSIIDGRGYHWRDLDDVYELQHAAEAPSWLTTLCLEKKEDTALDGGIYENLKDQSICGGHRNDTLFRKACVLRHQRFNEEEVRTAVFSMNKRLCEPPLSNQEVEKLVASALQYRSSSSVPVEGTAPRPKLMPKLHSAASIFKGKPPPVNWLVERIFPMGKLIALASPPGVGKSFLMLDLALQVTMPTTSTLLWDQTRYSFGGRVVARGKVVIISAEDDQNELHRRLYSLLDDKPMPEDLLIMSLPDQGFFTVVTGNQRTGMSATPEWISLKEEILKLKDVVLVIVDTLQAVSAGDLNAAEIAQAMMNELGEVANQSGSAVIVLHHLTKKAGAEATGPLSAQAGMDAIRGSGAIAGSVRAAYCLYPHPQGRDICKALDVRYEENKVVYGMVVKANGEARRDYTTYIRDESGLLRDCTHQYQRLTQDNAGLMISELLTAVTDAFQKGYPFASALHSENGLHKRRDELPKQFHNLPAKWFGEHAAALVEEGKLQKVRATNGFHYAPVIPIEKCTEVMADVSPNDNNEEVKPERKRVAKRQPKSKVRRT